VVTTTERTRRPTTNDARPTQPHSLTTPVTPHSPAGGAGSGGGLHPRGATLDRSGRGACMRYRTVPWTLVVPRARLSGAAACRTLPLPLGVTLPALLQCTPRPPPTDGWQSRRRVPSVSFNSGSASAVCVGYHLGTVRSRCGHSPTHALVLYPTRFGVCQRTPPHTPRRTRTHTPTPVRVAARGRPSIPPALCSGRRAGGGCPRAHRNACDVAAAGEVSKLIPRRMPAATVAAAVAALLHDAPRNFRRRPTHRTYPSVSVRGLGCCTQAVTVLHIRTTRRPTSTLARSPRS